MILWTCLILLYWDKSQGLNVLSEKKWECGSVDKLHVIHLTLYSTQSDGKVDSESLLDVSHKMSKILLHKHKLQIFIGHVFFACG